MSAAGRHFGGINGASQDVGKRPVGPVRLQASLRDVRRALSGFAILLYIFAQLSAVVHASDIADGNPGHAGQDCVRCLASGPATEPVAVEVVTPRLKTFFPQEFAPKSLQIVSRFGQSARLSRGPPHA